VHRTGLAGVQVRTRRSFCLYANSLAARTVLLLLVGACQCSHQSVKEILEIHDELLVETVTSLRELTKRVGRRNELATTTMAFSYVALLGDSSQALLER
jgi:hypothetical protein